MERVVAYSSSRMDETKQMHDAQLHQLVGHVEVLQNDVAGKETELLRQSASPTQASSILPRSPDGLAAVQPTTPWPWATPSETSPSMPDVALSPTGFLGPEDVGTLRCVSSTYAAVGGTSNSVASSSSGDAAKMRGGMPAQTSTGPHS
jgi:hypothetical protein